MDRLRGLLLKLRVLRRRDRVESELEEEIRFHLTMQIEKNLAEGMSPREARREAHKKFGGVERFKERSREAWGLRGAEDFVQDIKYALRMMRKNPVFTFVAVMTLALGIGANTALFSVVNGVLLTPLPFEDGEELALIWTRNQAQQQEQYFVSPQDFGDWLERKREFESLGGYWRTRATGTTDDGEPIALQQILSSANLFDVLGVRAHVGRTFVDDDGIPGTTPVAMLSYGAWQRMYGGDPAVVGSSIQLDGQPIELVGVLPPGAEWPKGGDIWTTITFPWTIQSRNARWLTAVGRLRDGATLEAAQGDMTRITSELAAEYPDSNRGWEADVVSLFDEIVGDMRRSLMALLGATGLVLLIACANVSNLLLSRAEVRSSEIAVRTAFGAGRWRLARQLMTESLALAFLGAALGIGMAWAGVKALLAVAPVGLPRLDTVGMDGTVLAVAAGSTVITALLFGLAPLVKMLFSDLAGTIKDGSKGSRGPGGGALQQVFAVTQLALAVTVVVGAGLLVKSFGNLRSADPGFVASEEKLTFEINLSQARFQTDDQVQQFYEQFLQGLRDRQGVRAVTMTSSLPLQEDRDYHTPFTFVDRAVEANEDPRAYMRQVDAQFFDVMGSELIDGRTFDSSDRMETAGVAIVNETLARRFWGDESPVGQRLTNMANRFGPLGAQLKTDVEIVGVVEDLKFADLKSEASPAVFIPYSQTSIRRMTIVVAGLGGTDGLLDAARDVAAQLDPSLPISNVTPIVTVLDDALSADRFSMLLLTTFGVLALVLASIGIYGVLAYGVEQRLREVGIRIALGAAARDVLGLVLKDGGRMIAVGLGVGVFGAVAASGLISSQLFGVEAKDPAVYGTVLGVLAVVAFVASLVPARRATRIDPITALKAD